MMALDKVRVSCTLLSVAIEGASREVLDASRARVNQRSWQKVQARYCRNNSDSAIPHLVTKPPHCTYRLITRSDIALSELFLQYL